MTDPRDLDILLREIDALIEENKNWLAERALEFVGLAEDPDDRRERILDLAAVMKLDGRDPVLDNIISSYDHYGKDGDILESAWATGDTVRELEMLRARLKAPSDNSEET